MAETMRAWQLARPGPLDETLSLSNTVPKPSANDLKAGQILIRTLSAGLNPVDYKLPGSGTLAKLILPFPKTPGLDVAGEVVAVGTGAEASVGDHVLGRCDPKRAGGALAEFTVLDADGFAVIPKDVDSDEAGGAGTAALTELQAIAPYVKPGDKIFINGGSGGTGTYGVQIAKLLGCHVTTTCSAEKAPLVKELGADVIIDYKTEDVEARLKQEGQVFKLALDNNGNNWTQRYQNCHNYLTPDGAFVLVGADVSGPEIAAMAMASILPGFLGGGKRKFVPFLAKNNKTDLNQLAEWMSQKKLKTIIEKSFEFEEVAEAYAHLKKGSSKGKVVVRVAKQ
ncbi:hypothetical protein B0I35DRAFT_420903 [Stachybotrys elegans]|uniref:Enoyl reductase (ER) domain-containing protein n=1 Tax=Stachybotrys elegans TaxID=80388 RepID=A0A8K0SZG1_9HYPO|nr:hypothetical protein B0I35DRAFT_420903 [Stachybotrys elegans]